MPIQRSCPACHAVYPETQTDCIRCPDTPAALVPATLIPANLMLGQATASGITTTVNLGNDQFTVERALGWGGMATAYVMVDSAGNRKVVKELRPHAKATVQAKMLTSFLREAEVQYKVGQWLMANPTSFPALPKGYGAFTALGRHYLAMDLMEGTDWDRLQDRISGPLSSMDVLQMGMEVCIILRNCLHGYSEGGVPKTLIHRDIKPANIQKLRATGTSCLLDFGIARLEQMGTATLARGGTRAGSPAFAPPELTVKGGVPTVRSDLYCLCSSMWALLAFAKEFPDTRPDQLQAIRASVPDPELQAILIKGTNETPGGRFASAEELLGELVRVYEASWSLPAHLQTAVSATTPVATPGFAPVAPKPAKPAKVQPVRIRWERTPVTWNAARMQFEKVIAGRVVQGKQALANVNVVIARIVDIPGGAKSANIATVPTDVDGNFTLDSADTTVDKAVQERRMTLHVQDSSGNKLAEDSRTIKRPLDWAKVWSKLVAVFSGGRAAAASLGQGVSAHWLAILVVLAGTTAAAAFLYSKPKVWKPILVGLVLLGLLRLIRGALAWWDSLPDKDRPKALHALGALLLAVGIPAIMATLLLTGKVHDPTGWLTLPVLPALWVVRYCLSVQRGQAGGNLSRLLLPRISLTWLATWLAWFWSF